MLEGSRASGRTVDLDNEVGGLLRARQADTVDRLFLALRDTSFSPWPASRVRAELALLVDRAIDVVLSEPFDQAEASAIGAAVVDLRFAQPEALFGAVQVLGQELVVELPADALASIQPRLVQLLAGVAAGYYAQARQLILEEQDQIRRALFVSRHAAEAAEEARRAAEATVHARTDLINAAAHDLRGPVTSIVANVDFLLRSLEREPTPGPDWLRHRAGLIAGAARRISSMVDELTDAAKLQAGQRLDLRLEPVDISALVSEVVLLRQSTANQAGVQVSVQAPTGLIVQADRARLERVVDNVLANAVKYSPEGTPVQVEVRAEGDGAVIVVRDRGVGIPPGELPNVFTPFFRASTAHGFPGMGIGLAGARTIVEQHGGQINVASAPGEGTTVTIRMPCEPVAAPPSA